MFSCEYYELFSSSYFKEHLQMAASSKFLRKHTIAWFFFVILSAFMKQKYFEQSFCFSFFSFLGVGGINLYFNDNFNRFTNVIFTLGYQINIALHTKATIVFKLNCSYHIWKMQWEFEARFNKKSPFVLKIKHSTILLP